MGELILLDGTPAVEIPLTQGKAAWVSPEDYERTARHKWRFRRGYAVCWSPSSNGKRVEVSMHQFILGVSGIADHWDRNGLNNTRRNLRPATPSQNGANSISNTNKTGYKGVYQATRSSRFYALIRKDYRRFYLGIFDTPARAAEAYNAKAVELFGEFARLNVLDPS